MVQAVAEIAFQAASGIADRPPGQPQRPRAAAEVARQQAREQLAAGDADGGGDAVQRLVAGLQQFACTGETQGTHRRLHRGAGLRLPAAREVRAAEAAGARDAFDRQRLGEMTADELTGEGLQVIARWALFADQREFGENSPGEAVALGLGGGTAAAVGEDQAGELAHRALAVEVEQRPCAVGWPRDLEIQPVGGGARRDRLEVFATGMEPQQFARTGLGAGAADAHLHPTAQRDDQFVAGVGVRAEARATARVDPAAMDETDGRLGHGGSVAVERAKALLDTIQHEQWLSVPWPIATVGAMNLPLTNRPVDFNHGDLRVATDHRSLAHADGTPFFWLADTAWELLHRLTRDEIAYYLDRRAAQGYTVVQVVALAEFDGLGAPTPEGFLPFIECDPARPDPAGYWDRLDWLLTAAAQRGLVIALLPTWGDKVNKAWGIGPELFTAENIAVYGHWLGARLAGHYNLVWVVGGDRSPNVASYATGSERDPRQLAIWRALAEALAAGDGGRHLRTFHPGGGDSSGRYFHADAWLDFNGQQNGHGRHPELWDRIRCDREREPAKPVIDLEPLYEEHPIGFDLVNGYAGAWHVRWYLWCDLLAGAAGHTYGCHPIWQCFAPGREPKTAPRMDWRTALELPGGTQMAYARALLMARGFPHLVPRPALVVGEAGTGGERAQAALVREGACAIIYIANGRAVTIDLAQVQGAEVRAWWFDPRTAYASEIGVYSTNATRRFLPPTSGPEQDWVLVLDSVVAGWAPLGG